MLLQQDFCRSYIGLHTARTATSPHSLATEFTLPGHRQSFATTQYTNGSHTAATHLTRRRSCGTCPPGPPAWGC